MEINVIKIKHNKDQAALRHPGPSLRSILTGETLKLDTLITQHK